VHHIFLYGSLRHLPLLAHVAGARVETLDLSPAHLPGFAVSWAMGQGFPLAHATPSGRAAGLLLRCDDAVRARLDYYERCFGYDLVEHDVDTDTDTGTGPQRALIYLPKAGLWQAGEDWRLEDWAARWGALSLDAAHEVMAAFGHEPPETVGARFGSIRARAQSRLVAAQSERGTLRKGWGRDTVHVAREETLANGFFRMRRLHLSHPTFDGGTTPQLSREVFDAVDAVTVLPYDPVSDRVLLIEQFRAAPFARGDAWPWSIEAIAGRRDPGETVETALRREALEEGGVTLSTLHPIAAYYPSTGALTEYLRSFVGIAQLSDAPERLAGLAQEGEDIRVFTLSFDEAMAALDAGELENAPLILSLLWLARARGGLRAGHGVMHA